MAVNLGGLIAISLLSSSLSQCRIITRPENVVTITGKEAHFKCSVSNARNIVIWSFTDLKDNSTLISIRLDIVVESTKYRIEHIIMSAGNRFHDLVITNVSIGDSGIYSCIDSTDKDEFAASLTLINSPNCHTLEVFRESKRGHRFSCLFHLSGLIGLGGQWDCDFSSNTSSVFTNRSYGELGPGVILYDMSVETKALNTREAPVCNLTIRALSIMTSVTRRQHLLSQSVPNFTYVLHQAAVPKFNITEGFNMAKGDSVGCFSESPLPVTYNIIVYDYDNANILYNSSSNATKIDMVGLYKVHCLARNDLNLKLVYMALKMVTVVEYHGEIQCIFSPECMRITRAIFGYKSPAYVLEKLYDPLCQDKQRIKMCVYRTYPCYISSHQQGMIDAFEFLCQDMGKEIYEYTSSIETLYRVSAGALIAKYPYVIPQELQRKLSVRMREAPLTQIRDIVYLNCQRLLSVASLFYHEYLAYLNHGEEVALWYREFYSRLYGVRLFEPHRLVSDLVMDSVDIEDCSRVRTSALCQMIKTCDRVYDMLINSISYGFVVIENVYAFVTHTCELSKFQMGECKSLLLENCDKTTYELYKPLANFQHLLCNTHFSEYLRFHNCFKRYFHDIRIKKAFKCTNSYADDLRDWMRRNVTKQESTVSEGYICMTTVRLMECIEKETSIRCGMDASLLQRKLLRSIMESATEEYFCTYAFTDIGLDSGIRRLLDHSSYPLLSIGVTCALFISYAPLSTLNYVHRKYDGIS